MADIEMVSYILVFALALIFSMTTIERKNFIFSFLSMLMWFTFADCHLLLAYTSNLIVLAYMFMALGLIFMIYGFALLFSSFLEKRKSKDWELI